MLRTLSYVVIARLKLTIIKMITGDEDKIQQALSKEPEVTLLVFDPKM